MDPYASLWMIVGFGGQNWNITLTGYWIASRLVMTWSFGLMDNVGRIFRPSQDDDLFYKKIFMHF
jgi:hypothetical protein